VHVADQIPPELTEVPGYQFLGPIGRGSMGRVVLARQLALGRNVAIKFVELGQPGDPVERAARFRREAELMAQVTHPNIVTIFDFGVANGCPFLVMEYVEGGDLRREMVPKKPMPLRRTLAVLRPIVEALDCLHHKGILHRDLKPENVLMQREDVPKVADFGIAVSGQAVGSLTRADVSMGTVGYVAPEQLYRLSVDERADQYSLASIAYEMLTGYKPLGAFPPPSGVNRDLSPAVDAVILRALSEDRDDRYPTIREFGDALERACAGAGPPARSRVRDGLPWIAAAAVVIAVSAAVLAGKGGRAGRAAGTFIEPRQSAPRRFAADPVAVPPAGRAPVTVVNSLGMKLVLVPAGTFPMGSPEPDPDARSNEKPAHRVTITRPFYLGAHEVTVGQFRAFVESTGYRTDAERDGLGGAVTHPERKRIEYGPQFNWRHPGHPKEQADDEPVVQVSWNDAVSFCRWLLETEGRPYRLPTEAEWEYACRAGTTTRWSSGDSLTQLEAFAWTPNSDSPTTHRVGTKAANPFGLFDMHGNVWEWCRDVDGPYRDDPQTDPEGPATGPERVLRGGAWDRKNVRRTKSAYRISEAPSARSNTYGFRVCRPAAP
jgi:formylglycine-generating enzyme required for sulfatase activity